MVEILPFHKHARLLARCYETGNKAEINPFDFLHTLNLSNLTNDQIIKEVEEKILRAKLLSFYRALSDADDIISKDTEEGRRLGITGTPMIYINGHPIMGFRPRLQAQI